MESRAKLLGHPVHPQVIVFPLGLLGAAVVFDVLYVVSGNTDLATAAWWAIVAGLAGGILAAGLGLIDYLALPAGTRAKRVALVHGAGNGLVLTLFVISLMLRIGDHAYLPDLLPLVFSLAGGLVAVGTGWLGGELVYRLRVGVDLGANLDAPNSVTTGPVAFEDR